MLNAQEKQAILEALLLFLSVKQFTTCSMIGEGVQKGRNAGFRRRKKLSTQEKPLLT